jgi:HEAT repeat protein
MKRGDVLAAIADLTGDDVARRQSAIGVLEAMPQGFLEDHPLPRKKLARYVPRLAPLLRSDVPVDAKKWCAQLIGESGIQSPEILDSLVSALELKDDGVLVSTLWAIGQYRVDGTAAVDALIRHSRHPNREVRWRAVWALQQIHPAGQQYAEVFAKLFDDCDYLVRGYAVLGFISAATPSPWAVAQLQRAAKDEDEMPRIHAQRALELWPKEGRA